MENARKLRLTTPEGKIEIFKSKIAAVCECNGSGKNETKVLCQIYVDGDKEPFNVLEDFEHVSSRI